MLNLKALNLPLILSGVIIAPLLSEPATLARWEPQVQALNCQSDLRVDIFIRSGGDVLLGFEPSAKAGIAAVSSQLPSGAGKPRVAPLVGVAAVRSSGCSVQVDATNGYPRAVVHILGSREQRFTAFVNGKPDLSIAIGNGGVAYGGKIATNRGSGWVTRAIAVVLPLGSAIDQPTPGAFRTSLGEIAVTPAGFREHFLPNPAFSTDLPSGPCCAGLSTSTFQFECDKEGSLVSVEQKTGPASVGQLVSAALRGHRVKPFRNGDQDSPAKGIFIVLADQSGKLYLPQTNQ